MLTETQAKSLGFQGNFNHYHIASISFYGQGTIWNKNKSTLPFSNKINQYHKYGFFKHGKTFGMETNRYIQYHDGLLFYFDNEVDKEFKGYCPLQNLYMYYFPSGQNYVMHLTNGSDASTFYFSNNSFFKSIQPKLIKDVVQLNFKEKYTQGIFLGQGTFSRVYAVTNRISNKKFAAKIIPKVDSTGFHTRGIVQEQKRILKRLNSQRVCKMQEFFEDTDNYIFVLEFLNGQDLNVIFKEKKNLSLPEVVFILKQTLKSLLELHKLNIIHRDLKPHNILVNLKQKSVKLIDFGLSLLYDHKTDLSKYMRCGTMGYIAPQVVNNCQAYRKPYDTKSDMFGFGIVFHMLLMGSNPIRGRTYRQTVDKNVKCQITLDKKNIALKYGKECLNLLQNLLQKNPKLRPTCQQALKCSFFQEKHKDEETHMDSQVHNPQILQNNHGDEVNYIEDKQLLMGQSKIMKDDKSPTKKTNSSWRSMTCTKISGLA